MTKSIAARTFRAPLLVASPLLLLLLVSNFLQPIPNVCAASVDRHENCKAWSEMGECDKNPGYMRENCAKSCDEYDAEIMRDDKDIEGVTSFYDLEAKDIDGNVIKFDSYRGKAVLITNVASYCGYTESHYKALVSLYDQIRSTEKVEILAFPCNQFGQQEPEQCSVIKAFASKKGVQFTMMDKIDVNGPDASPVYKYLKKVAPQGPKRITWNFATYFLVSPDGSVTSYSGISPLELKDTILDLVAEEEL